MQDLVDLSGGTGYGSEDTRAEGGDYIINFPWVPLLRDRAVDEIIMTYLGIFGNLRANNVIRNPSETREGFAFLISWFHGAAWSGHRKLPGKRNGRLHAGPMYAGPPGCALVQDSFAVRRSCNQRYYCITADLERCMRYLATRWVSQLGTESWQY